MTDFDPDCTGTPLPGAQRQHGPVRKWVCVGSTPGEVFRIEHQSEQQAREHAERIRRRGGVARVEWGWV